MSEMIKIRCPGYGVSRINGGSKGYEARGFEGTNPVTVEINEELAEEFKQKYGFRIDECQNPIEFEVDRIYLRRVPIKDPQGIDRINTFNIATLNSLENITLDEIIPSCTSYRQPHV
jgi:hypothetical protein